MIATVNENDFQEQCHLCRERLTSYCCEIRGHSEADAGVGGVLYGKAPWTYGPDAFYRLWVCGACIQKIAGLCPICRAPKGLDLRHCHECARALAVADRHGAAMEKTSDETRRAFCDGVAMIVDATTTTAAIQSETRAMDFAKHADDLRAMIARQQHLIDAVLAQSTQKETLPMATTTDNATTTPDLGSELEEGLWRGGIELAVEEARNLVATLLTIDMDPKKAKATKALFIEAFRGRFGVPVVAASFGGVLYAMESQGVKLPLVSASLARRVGREMRVLSVSSVTKAAWGAGKEVVLQHGSRLLDALQGLGKIAERTGVRVAEIETSPAPQGAWTAPPAGAVEEARSTRSGGAS